MENVLEEQHAHAVMEMMINSGKTYSRKSLVEEIREKFGENALFHTCSVNGLDPHQLIDFLAAKGKLVGTEEAFSFDAGRMCQGH